MVQTKFGIPAVAGRQMEVLSTAVLLATLSPPKPPRKAEWRTLMDQLSAISCEAYRSVRSPSHFWRENYWGISHELRFLLKALKCAELLSLRLACWDYVHRKCGHKGHHNAQADSKSVSRTSWSSCF